VARGLSSTGYQRISESGLIVSRRGRLSRV